MNQERCLIKCPKCGKCAVLFLNTNLGHPVGMTRGRTGGYSLNGGLGKVVCRSCAYTAETDTLAVPEQLYLQDDRLGVTLFACNSEHLQALYRYFIEGDHEVTHYPVKYRSGLFHMGRIFKLKGNQRKIRQALDAMGTLLHDCGEQ